MRLQEAIGRNLRARRHTVLLLAIVAMFAVRPFFGDTGAATIVFSFTMLLVMLVALLTVQIDDLVGERRLLLVQRRRRNLRRLGARRAGGRRPTVVVVRPRPVAVSQRG